MPLFLIGHVHRPLGTKNDDSHHGGDGDGDGDGDDDDDDHDDDDGGDGGDDDDDHDDDDGNYDDDDAAAAAELFDHGFVVDDDGCYQCDHINHLVVDWSFGHFGISDIQCHGSFHQIISDKSFGGLENGPFRT